MSAPRSPKSLSLIAVGALVAVLAVAGCGGAGGKVVSGQTPPSNPPSGTVEPQSGAGTEAATSEEGEAEGGEEGTSEGGEGTSEEGGTSEGGEAGAEGETGAAQAEAGGAEEAEGGEAAGGATASAEGMTVFTSNCGTCHTLAAAGTSGNVGPNLDELMPSESTVEYQVINGGGAMPAFGKEGILSSAEVKAVAAYVSSEAGK